MFHWICPECGQEIARGVTECATCEPPEPEVRPEEGKVLIPEIIPFDPDARLRELVGSMRGMSASPAPLPVVRVHGPIRFKPVIPMKPPEPEAPQAPDVASLLDDPALREPRKAVPCKAPIRGSSVDALLGPPASRPRPLSLKVRLPLRTEVGSSQPSGPLLGDILHEAFAIPVAMPAKSPILSAVEPAVFLSGPRLPHELISLDAAGVSHVVRVDLSAAPPPAAYKMPIWMVSVVTATVVAGVLSLALYAMPGAASQAPPAPPMEVLEPLTGSEIVEVTGIRIVSAAGRLSEIRYVVVNHSDQKLDGAGVQVTLRPRSRVNSATIAKFTFTVPKLGPHQSQELFSLIEDVVIPGSLPDWRELRADAELLQ